LTSLTIPSSVKSIGSYASDGCSALTDIYYAGSAEDWAKISISGGNNNITNATIHYNSSAQ